MRRRTACVGIRSVGWAYGWSTSLISFLPRDRALQHALAQLSEDEHALFHARYEEKRSVGQIADSLGIKYGAAAARLRRLKERLRALMESQNRTP